MESKLGDMMQSTFGNIKKLVEVNNIVGEPISTPDGLTLVPFSKVSFGFGGAGGDMPESKKERFGGGSAAGVKIEPIGFLAVKDGSVRMINVMPPAQSSVDRILELVPEVLDKVEQLTDKKSG